MNEKIKVLQVFDKMDRGGAETFIMNVYRKLDRTKFQFDFIVFTKETGAYDEEILSLGGKIYYIPKLSASSFYEFNKKWNEFFKDHKEYSIIHAHAQGTAGCYLKIAKKYGLITISHSHTTSYGEGYKKYLKMILQYPIRKIVDYKYACSKESAIWLYGNKKLNEVTIIPNGIDLNNYQNNKIDEKIVDWENRYVIGHVGRFIHTKNHIFMIELLEKIIPKKKNVLLVFIGTGPLEEQMKQMVIEKNLTEYVQFMGVRSDVPNLLKQMDLFLFPSIYEGLPLSVVEAEATGLPCVLSDTISKEVIVSNRILFLDLKKEEEWVENICSFPIKKVEFNENLNKFSIENTVSMLEENYTKMLRMEDVK